MELNELLNELDSSTIAVVKNGLQSKSFSGTTLLSGSVAAALDDFDVIFFADASYFNTLPEELRRGRAFFLHLDEPLKPLSGDSFVATLYEFRRWIEAFETVSHEFRELQKKKDLVISMTGLVNRGANLKTLLNVAAEAIGAPASVLDNSLNFVAVSDNFPSFVTNGEDANDNTVPIEAFPLLKAKGLTNIRKPFDLRVFDWTDHAGNVYTNHYALIHAGDAIIGSMSFFTHGRHLRPSRMAMLPTIAQIISIQMERSDAHTLNKTLYYARLFKLLESGLELNDMDRLQKQFSTFGYKLKPRMHMLCVDFSQQLLAFDSVRPLAERLLGHIENAVFTINQTEILFLSSVDGPGEHFCDIDALEQQLTSTAIFIGASSGFTDIHQAKHRIDEARRAIAAARRLNTRRHVFLYSTLRLDDLILHVDDPYVIHGCQFSPLIRLLEEDEREGTELTSTLWRYLQNPAHPADVAAELFIHKNTLYYRLDKIRQIMGCDFKDAETIANIQLTFHILRIQSRFDPNQPLIERMETEATGGAMS